MSVGAKQTLLNELSEELSTKLVWADAQQTIQNISYILDKYQVEHIAVNDCPENELLDAFLNAMEVQGRSPATIAHYRYIIQRVLDTIKVPQRQLTVYHIRKYLADEKARGISDTTLNGTRQVLNAYFNWLQRENLIQHHPVANVGSIKCQKKVKKAYSEIDLERLKEHCTNLRDKAIIYFLYSTGCRIHEMTQLNRTDVDLDRLEIKVLGKGNKERIIFMGQVAGMVLREYLDSRTDNHEALFIGKGTRRLLPNGVRLMLRKLGELADVEHVHPHKFRRTLATNLIRHGMPIQEVASILGHEKLDTTMRYIVLDQTQIKQHYNKYA